MYVTSVQIGSSEIIDYCRKDATQIDVQSNGRTSTASIEATITPTQRAAMADDLVAQSAIRIIGSSRPQGLANGTFERELESWNERGAVLNSSDQLEGSACVELSQGVIDYVSQFCAVDITVGESWTASCYVDNQSTADVWIEVAFYTQAGGYISSSAVNRAPSAGYVLLSNTSTVPSNAAQLRVTIYTEGAGSGTVYVDRVQLVSSSQVMFSGYVSRVEPRVISPGLIRYSIQCQDGGRVLDRTVVASETYTSQTDVDIIADLFATYLPAITTTGVTGASPVVTLDSITFENKTLRQCLEAICDRTGAEWRLGFDDDLKYFAPGANDAPFDFSEAADGSSTEYYLQDSFGYQEEFSTPANSVSVVGYQPPKPDPATLALSVTADADDGYVQYSNIAGVGDTSPPDTGDSSVVATTSIDYLKLEYTSKISSNVYSLGLIRFDTSAIPDDAVVLSATLEMRMYSGALNNTEMEFGVAYYAGSNWPISNPDDYSTAYINPASVTPDAVGWRYVNKLSLGGASTPGLNQWALSNPNDNILKTGYTGFRLVLGTVGSVTGDNYVFCKTRESSRADWRPKLTVIYQQPQQPPVTGSASDATSISLYGTFEKTISDPACTTAGECDARAAVEVERYAYPRKSVNVTYDRDGLTVGDSVHFTSTSLGIDDDFTVKKMTMRWPATQDRTRYAVELGEFRPDLVEYLRKNNA